MPANDLGREIIPQWPATPIAPGSRQTLEAFYTLVDTESESAFQEWTSLFVAEGVLEVGPKYVKGHAALEEERRASWKHIKSRKHHIYRVYTIHDHGVDLLVIGAVDIVLRNGRRFTQEFAQNFLLEDNHRSAPDSPAQQGGERRPLIRKFQAWIDSIILTRAIAEEGE